VRRSLSTRLRRDLGSQLERQDNQRLAAVGADYQDVAVDEPLVELAETIGAAFDFDNAVDAENRHRQVAKVRAAG